MKILITGAGGYVGQLLIRRFTAQPEIEKIICLDIVPQPDWFSSDFFVVDELCSSPPFAAARVNEKIIWIKADLAKDDWEVKIPKEFFPQIVIHSAFQIRTPYAKEKEQEKSNLTASVRVFDFCFENKVEKLIYLSSVAVYGARKENIGKLFTEEDRPGENFYPYGLQKKLVEEKLKEIFERKKPETRVFVIRPASITGPFAEKKRKLGLLSLIKNILPVLPFINPHWARQYLHEDDLIEAISFLIFKDIAGRFEIFNLAPPQILTMPEMAKLLKKKTIKFPAFLLKTLFFLGWHLGRGCLPTPPGSVNSLIYPINVEGRKITRFGFCYQYSSQEAFEGKKGRYKTKP